MPDYLPRERRGFLSPGNCNCLKLILAQKSYLDVLNANQLPNNIVGATATHCKVLTGAILSNDGGYTAW